MTSRKREARQRRISGYFIGGMIPESAKVQLPPLSGRCLLICHPANMRIHSADGVFGGVRVTSFEGRFRKWFTRIAILVVVFLFGLSATRHNGRPRFASAFGTRSLFDCSNSPYAASADFA